MMHVALLRAVNVVGNNRIRMPELCQLFADLGFDGARSWLNSGNVVFDSGRRAGELLERLLEAETEKRFRLRVDCLVRTGRELQKIVQDNPFVNEAKDDPSHLLVMFLKKAPRESEVKSLRAAIIGPEVVDAVGRQAYVIYPDGIGRSKLTSNLIEKTLGTRGTGRNWNTALKLLSMVKG